MTQQNPDYDAYLDDPDDDATDILDGTDADMDTPAADDPDPEPDPEPEG
jgi:hypothetical protein